MTNKLEKQFFDTFGIEPKKQCYYWDCPYSTGNIANDTAMNERDCNSCKNPDKEVYPQITDRILLKLICYLSRCYLDLIPEYACFKTIDQLKEHVLKCALKFKIANTVPMFYSQDLQALFKEDTNDR